MPSSQEGLIIKRLQRANGDTRILSSNPAYPPVEIALERFVESYKVVARVRMIERRV